MNVENLNGYANQFIITDDHKTTFQSYDSEVATIYDAHTDVLKPLVLNGDVWDYSATTRRHFKTFINQYTGFNYENKQQWLKEIENNDKIEVIKEV